MSIKMDGIVCDTCKKFVSRSDPNFEYIEATDVHWERYQFCSRECCDRFDEHYLKPPFTMSEKKASSGEIEPRT